MIDSTLVRLFLRDLRRRRMLWLLAVVLTAALTFNYYVNTLEQSPEDPRASKELAEAAFGSMAQAVRTMLLPFVAILSVLIAPESRRNGTTQFLLSVPVSRARLAASQFVALCCLVGGAVLIAHLGIGYAGYGLGQMSGAELALSWIALCFAALLEAAAIFCLSLTMSAAVTLLIILVAPWFVELAMATLPSLTDRDVTVPISMLEHAKFLFPDVRQLVFWPRPWLQSFGSDVVASGGLMMTVVHESLTIAFWVVLGLFLYRRYNFGSRTLLR